MQGCGLDFLDSREGQVSGCCEHGNEPQGLEEELIFVMLNFVHSAL
jgi:hypothetical protein